MVSQNWKEILFFTFIAFLSESMAIYYSYQIGAIIRFIKADGESIETGLWLVAKFVACMIAA